MFTLHTDIHHYFRNFGETPSPKAGVQKNNESRVALEKDRQFMISELSKIPWSQWFTFVEDSKNARGVEVFYIGTSFPVAKISWSSILPLEQFPTIDVHGVDGNRFIEAFDDPKWVGNFLQTIKDRQEDRNFVLNNLKKVGESKWFQFQKNPINPNYIDVFIAWYRTRLASFSWASSPLWVLLDFPTINVKIWQNQYEEVLESKDEVSKYLDTLKKQAKFLGIVPWSL